MFGQYWLFLDASKTGKKQDINRFGEGVTRAAVARGGGEQEEEDMSASSAC